MKHKDVLKKDGVWKEIWELLGLTSKLPFNYMETKLTNCYRCDITCSIQLCTDGF